MSRFPFRRPPRALRRPGVQLDNIAIVPASLIPAKAHYQALANALPYGAVLIVLPSPASREYQMLTKVKALFEAKGHRVTTITTDEVDRTGQLLVGTCVV
jgi:hypothetical protein